MDITQLANLGEFVGGLAVVVTLIYLAVQVRESRRLAQSEAMRDISRDGWASLDGMATERDLVVACLQDFEARSQSEQYRFSFLLSPLFNNLDQALHMLQLGLETRDEVDRLGNICVALARETGGMQWWEIVKPFLSRQVDSYLQERLSQPATLPPKLSEAVRWFAPDEVPDAEAT